MLRRAITYLHHLFILSPPRLDKLFCYQVYLSQRPFLLLHWESTSTYKVEIAGLKKFYKNKGTYLFKIPSNLDLLVIIYRNVWFKKKQVIRLKSISVNQSILSDLIPTQRISNKGLAINISNFNTVNKLFKINSNSIQNVEKKFKIKSTHLKIINTQYEKRIL